jgi:predicted nucleotidyltransferase
MTEKDEINALLQRLTSVYSPKEVLLFGSRARGTHREDSDIDLCLIFDKLPKRKLEMLQDLYRSIFTVHGHAVDLLVFQEAAYQERAQRNGTIEHTIQHEGQVIYG